MACKGYDAIPSMPANYSFKAAMSYMSRYGPQNMEARYQTIYISLVPKAIELLQPKLID